MAIDPTPKIRTCPRCGGAIVWVDGEPLPDLVYESIRPADREPKIIGCSACAASGQRARVKSPAKVATEELVKTTGAELRAAVELGHDVAETVGELVTEGSALYDKAKGLFKKFSR